MLILEIKEPEIKVFMNKLLKDDAFDGFEVRGVEINTFTRFEISGMLTKDRDEEGEPESGRSFCTWAELKPYVFQIIKGGKRPRLMRLVFSHPVESVQDFHPNAAAQFLNIAYEGSGIVCTAATSQKSFSLDRKMDDMWEAYIEDFLSKKGIVCQRPIS